MNITFGLFLDGYIQRDPPDSLNRVICGPVDLVDILETRLGLKTATASPARRIVEYRRLLEETLNTRKTFYAESFHKDRLAVAQTLLTWRDELVEAGWDGKAPRKASVRPESGAS
jgi:hypothetical protein